MDNLLNKIIYSSLSDEDFYENFGLINVHLLCNLMQKKYKACFWKQGSRQNALFLNYGKFQTRHIVGMGL